MKKVVYIRDTDTESLYRVGVADSESSECVGYTVNVHRHPALLKIAVGEVLDEEIFSLVTYSDEECRAYKKALSLLSFSDNNERTLARKLITHGISREVAENICREMVSLGYIDERRQLERLVATDAQKHYGPHKILARLSSKGYQARDIREVMHALTDSGEIDFSLYAKRLIEKKYPGGATPEERRALLYKHGYKLS